MGNTRIIPPSQRYAHLQGVACPKPSAVEKGETETLQVLARLQRGPLAGDGLPPLTPKRVLQCVYNLRRRGYSIDTAKRYDRINDRPAPSMFTLRG